MNKPEDLGFTLVGEDGRLNVPVGIDSGAGTTVLDGNVVMVGGAVLLVGNDGHGQTQSRTEIAAGVGRIRRDQDHRGVELCKLTDQFLIATSLGATKRSPVPTVKNQNRVLFLTERSVVTQGTPAVVWQFKVDGRAR